jgi:hypothetical protein
VEPSSGQLPLGEILPADLAHKRGLFEAFLKVAIIKKTPVLKREELYQGLIEPGWGAGLLNPAQGGERNILYMTPLTLKSFLSNGMQASVLHLPFSYERCSHSNRSLPGK